MINSHQELRITEVEDNNNNYAVAEVRMIAAFDVDASYCMLRIIDYLSWFHTMLLVITWMYGEYNRVVR